MTRPLPTVVRPVAPVVLALAATLGCTRSVSVSFGGGSPLLPPTRVPAKPSTPSVTAEEAGTLSEVRFTSEAERPVAEAILALAREAVAHLAQVAEQPVGGWAILLVTAAHANAAPQHLRASADVVLHVWYVSERPLKEMASTWVWVRTLIHELWHGLEPPGMYPDRWLRDGLAEWVAASFAPNAHPRSSSS